MKNIKIILLSIITPILLISCDPCQEVDCPNPFTDEELLWLPYSEGDKLVFLDLNSTDSLIYQINSKKSERLEPTDNASPYCTQACYYHISIKGDRIIRNGEEERFSLGMNKTIIEFRLSSFAGTNYEFVSKLADAIRLDSISVNNYFVKDVYKYICNPEQEKVAETYIHQGMGLVKIVFRDGREFELVEHTR